MEYGDQPDICLWNINKFLNYFKIEEITKNLNQVGRPRDLNPGPPECESRALPRRHLARLKFFIIANRKNLIKENITAKQLLSLTFVYYKNLINKDIPRKFLAYYCKFIIHGWCNCTCVIYLVTWRINEKLRSNCACDAAQLITLKVRVSCTVSRAETFLSQEAFRLDFEWKM